MPYKRPTFEEIRNRIVADLEGSIEQKTPILKKNIFRVLATVFAAAVHLLYGFIAWMFLQLFPDTAEGEFLERWCAVWGITRKKATFAYGTVTITGVNGSVLEAGTVFQNTLNVQYITQDEVTINAGTALVTVTAQESGVIGNMAAGDIISLVSPVAGIDSNAVIGNDGIANGFDIESFDDLRARLLLRIQNVIRGGTETDYEQWALEVSGVTRAWAYENWYGGGTVGLMFVLDNQADIIPNQAKIDEVAAYIETKRPLCSRVITFAPVKKIFDFILSATPNTSTVKANIEAEISSFVFRNAVPNSTVYLSQINEAISSAEGEIDHILSTPAANVTIERFEIGVMGNITWA